MKIALAASAAFPNLIPSNAAYAKALATEGAEVTVLAWNRDPLDAFLAADMVVLRQTWDYILDPGGSAAWAVRLEALGGRMEAPAARAIWNNDKRSLVEFAALGVMNTATQTRLDPLAPVLDASITTEQVVLKPAFGGGGHGVVRCHRDALAEGLADVARVLPGQPVMAQEFLPEIAQGEWKMSCIDGKVAVTVRARPTNGEFRINSEFAPEIETLDPPEPARRAAESLLEGRRVPLYARVDGVMRDGGFVCTEVELTDPDLFLDCAPEMARRLAKATLARL